MTDEFNYGQFTQAEVDEQIQRELERERDRAARIVLGALLAGYAVGLICGALVL